MSTAAVMDTPSVAEDRTRPRRSTRPIPFRTIVGVELRKAFDTRSGFWLMVAIAAAGVLATGAVLAFASDSDLTYDNFAGAIGVPMTILLPVVAILAVTGEWSQRAGLTTFTLVPHRGRVIRAKLVVTIAIGARLDGAGPGRRRARQHRRHRAQGRRHDLGPVVHVDPLHRRCRPDRDDGRLHARRR